MGLAVRRDNGGWREKSIAEVDVHSQSRLVFRVVNRMVYGQPPVPIKPQASAVVVAADLGVIPQAPAPALTVGLEALLAGVSPDVGVDEQSRAGEQRQLGQLVVIGRH
jgi:hypothetical protein